MNEVRLKLNGLGEGLFEITENNKRLAEMVLSVSASELSVFHTEVAPEAEGKGLAKKLLESMVAYAREHQLQVIALCPYVHAQFKGQPEKYADIWKQQDMEG